MDWLLSILMIIMNIILGRKDKLGWVMLVGVSFLWIYYAISIHQYGLIPASLANVCVGAYNTAKWYYEEKRNHKEIK